jgi:hypothetical protein
MTTLFSRATAAVYVAAMRFALLQARQGTEYFGRTARWSLLGAWAILLTAFLASPFGREPTGRYLVHLYPPLAILTGIWFASNPFDEMLQGAASRYLSLGLLVACLGYNLLGNVRAVVNNPPGLTTQAGSIADLPHRYDDDLIRFLDEIHADRGYTSYWVTYRLAFLTQEQILLSPKLPYKEDLSYIVANDRYPPYTEEVNKSDHVVYVTSDLPALDTILRARFEAIHVSVQEQHIGPYTIFYDLSRTVSPEDLDLYSYLKP